VSTPAVLFPRSAYDSLAADLLSTPHLERAAVGFAGLRETTNGPCLLFRDWMPVPHDEYIVQLGNHLEVSAIFWARAAKRARQTGEALVIVHSHPREPGVPTFSPSDDNGERVLVPKLRARASVPVAAIVIGPNGHSARAHLGSGKPRTTAVKIVGEPPHTAGVAVDRQYHRQALALGDVGHAILQELTVGVVGVGGTGSHVAQQLLHMGVGSLLVIDPDHVDDTNLSRLVGARVSDVGARLPKVHVTRRLARSLRARRRLRVMQDSVTDAPAARRLLDCDLVFGCTDSQWARYVLNAVAYQYFVPVVDIGVELQVGSASGGRVSWLLPDLPCLWCRGVLNPEAIRIEQLAPTERAEHVRRGYVSGADVTAPAVVSINGVVASLAVTEFLARWTGFVGDTPRAPELSYRLADGSVRRCIPADDPACSTCSPEGQWGAGDLAPRPWRVRADGPR
jgi:molybdopterin/thiamine biosynthesis adenylyltransferase